MSLELARTVADAVLFEGYLLYPYRATSRKNQVRWQFGVLGPAGAAEAGAGEEPDMSAQCLLRSRPDGRVTVHVRFLQLQTRSVERATARSRALRSGRRAERRRPHLAQMGRGSRARDRARPLPADGPGAARPRATGRRRWRRGHRAASR
ncbi:MAG: hypothetical protein WKF73_17270 [Nocardioidaceae bacterium]